MKDQVNGVTAEVGSLFTNVRWCKSKQPKRADILECINQALPWDLVEADIRPHYQADIRATGRKGYSLRMMLRCYIVQRLWDLSDDGVESLILDSHSVCKFIGSDSWQPRPPSATAIRNFRKLIDTKQVTEHGIWWRCYWLMRKAGFDVRVGKMVEPMIKRVNND
ncbi:MAG: transposase [Proteobacteria bacterium]|jgi:hypothetical protein|nr:transposase [Pseudomonadota bacterium]